MTSFVLPHEVRGDGAHRVTAVHGRSAGRPAYAAVPAGPDHAAFPYAFVGLRGDGEARDANPLHPARVEPLPRAGEADTGRAGSEA
ncbi:hypothetical protein [Streptomyces fagopyri]